MSYLVIAPCVVAKDQEGKNHHRYEGDVISWLSDEQAEHFISSELVTEVGSAPADSDEDDDRPAKSASKAEWVEFAVAKGYDRDEVEALSKADIQALEFD